MTKRNLCRSFATITLFLLVLSPLIVIMKGQNLKALALTSYSGKNFGGSGFDDGKDVVQTGDGGFALSGTTQSFGKGNSDLWLICIDGNFDTIWNQTYGGPEDELGGYVIFTNDGGFALVGYTKSYGSGDFDFWLVKTDTNGNIQWNQTYGGSGLEKAGSAIQTVDGGYVIVGAQYPSSAGSLDFLIVKTDSEGVEQWRQTYGGAYWDEATSVIQTNDGGFLIAGYTYSFGADPGLSEDFWLVKTNSAGDMEWSETYGGVLNDRAQCAIQTQDGGFAILGYSYSYGSGENDFWLVKTNSRGNLEWSETYGGPEREKGFSLIETNNGGFVMVGYSFSVGIKSDFWIVKTDAFGTVQRTQTFGGDSYDEAYSVVETIDGGFVMIGSTYSFGEGNDFWLVKTDSTLSPLPTPEPTPPSTPPPPLSSEIEWENSYGPLSGNDLVQTFDGGYAIAGTEAIYKSASRGPGNWVNQSALLIKTDALGNVQWKRNFTDAYSGQSVIQIDDGGFVMAGPNKTRDAFWLAKTNANGTVEWSKTYLEGNTYVGFTAIQTENGDYVLAGYVRPNGTDNNVAVLVRTDKHGNLLWKRSYTDNGYFSSIVESDDGGFVLVGEMDNEHSWFVKTDANGDIEWDKTLHIYAVDYLTSLSKTSDGGYILSGKTSPNGISPFNALLVKTDSNGNVQWSKTYEIYPNFVRVEEDHGSHPEQYSQSFSYTLQTQKSGYISAGSLSERYQYVGSWILMVRTDANGNVEWKSRYNYGDVNPGNPYQFGDNRFGFIVATNDGGFALVSTTEYEVVLVKFSPSTQASPDKSPISETPSGTQSPFLNAWNVASVVILIVVGLILLVYFKKRKHQAESFSENLS
jgi:hypothetical protein